MKKILPIIIALIIVGGGAFYGGMSYEKSKVPSDFSQRFQEMGAAGMGLRGGNIGQDNAGSGFVSGEVISKDETSLTVKLRDGGSKIVFFSASTQVSEMAAGAVADIVVGEQVMITGTQNDDGSYTAKTIQLTPRLIQQ
jgi:hypothetical protein